MRSEVRFFLAPPLRSHRDDPQPDRAAIARTCSAPTAAMRFLRPAPINTTQARTERSARVRRSAGTSADRAGQGDREDRERDDHPPFPAPLGGDCHVGPSDQHDEHPELEDRDALVTSGLSPAPSSVSQKPMAPRSPPSGGPKFESAPACARAGDLQPRRRLACQVEDRPRPGAATRHRGPPPASGGVPSPTAAARRRRRSAAPPAPWSTRHRTTARRSATMHRLRLATIPPTNSVAASSSVRSRAAGQREPWDGHQEEAEPDGPSGIACQSGSNTNCRADVQRRLWPTSGWG